METNKNAPVQSNGSIVITAPADKVWAVMTDVDNWPSWNKDVKTAQLFGELQAGSTMVWQAGPGTIRSELQEVVAPEKLAWTGKTFGIHAVHVWKLSESNGITTVTTDESWEGLPVKFMKSSLQKQLDAAIQSGLQYLKAACEEQPQSVQ